MFGLDRAGDGFIWADFTFRRPNIGKILAFVSHPILVIVALLDCVEIETDRN